MRGDVVAREQVAQHLRAARRIQFGRALAAHAAIGRQFGRHFEAAARVFLQQFDGAGLFVAGAPDGAVTMQEPQRQHQWRAIGGEHADAGRDDGVGEKRCDLG